MQPQAVEKQLKAFIIAHDNKVQKIHNLDVLLSKAITIDESFSNIKDPCSLLNKYTPNIKYAGNITITEKNIKNVITG